MPGFLRKSITVGGVRFTVSRHGVAVAGETDQEVRGQYVYLGRGGIGYRKAFALRAAGERRPAVLPPIPEPHMREPTDLLSVTTLELGDATAQELVEMLNGGDDPVVLMYMIEDDAPVGGQFQQLVGAFRGRSLAGPRRLHANIDIPTIETGDHGVYLLPDQVLIRDGATYSGFSL